MIKARVVRTNEVESRRADAREKKLCAPRSLALILDQCGGVLITDVGVTIFHAHSLAQRRAPGSSHIDGLVGRWCDSLPTNAGSAAPALLHPYW